LTAAALQATRQPAPDDGEHGGVDALARIVQDCELAPLSATP
jgi:hypothetical protein